MPQLFGTDGVRGVANQELTPDLALALGRAAGLVLAGPGDVVVGRDTRLSGPMLEAALVAGLCSAGAGVRLAGIFPSPGVAFLTVDEKASLGGVVSASHNPVADNGIKFFSDQGLKLSAESEARIEEAMAEVPENLPLGDAIGGATVLDDARDRYLSHLAGSIDGSLDGLHVVLDCAFGAAYDVGPAAFRAAGAQVDVVNAEPDGRRINVDCGSTSLKSVARRVVESGADLGLAFDGDADRVLAVDERGEEVDGDHIMALAAVHLLDAGELTNNLVVATVMSNLGFRRVLEARGIEVITAPVGDKFVMEAMTAHGAMLGGEQSGHLIFSRYATTGDGILTALQLARMVQTSEAPLSRLAHFWEPYPQVLVNVSVGAKERLDDAEGLWDEVHRIEEGLGSDGRVLLRASGTEPVVRVMVEAAAADAAERTAETLAEAVRRHLA